MKSLSIYTAVIAGLMLTSGHSFGQAAAPAATNAVGPRMTFATKDHHFGKVMSGEKVKYTYVFTNTGDQTLVISKVTPGCHCTAIGDWTKAHDVEPGKAGEIPIQFDSGAFRGTVHRTILVASNDKLAPSQTLSFDCTIWKALEISPQMARINIMPDSASNSTAVVQITNQSDIPITLSNPTSANAKFKAELATLKPGYDFEVTITALPPFTTGNTVGTVTVNTSLSNMPTVSITAVAVLQQAVTVSPMQIALPPEVNRWTTNIFRITANTSSPLALSDLQVSDQRASAEIKEVAPGRIFQVTVAFPPGFQVTIGKSEQVTLKSNNPRFPLISVPIVQFPRHAAMSQPVHLKAMSQNPPTPPVVGHP